MERHALAHRIARKFLASSQRNAAIQNLSALTTEQKGYLRRFGKAMEPILREFTEARFSMSGSVYGDWQSGKKMYVKDGFGRKSILAGKPHAKVVLFMSILTEDGNNHPVREPLEVLIAQDGSIALIKNDMLGGKIRATKSVEAEDLGKEWATYLAKLARRFIQDAARSKAIEEEVQAQIKLRQEAEAAAAKARQEAAEAAAAAELLRVKREEKIRKEVRKILQKALQTAKARSTSMPGLKSLEATLDKEGSLSKDETLWLKFTLLNDSVISISIVVDSQKWGQSAIKVELTQHKSNLFNIIEPLGKAEGTLATIKDTVPSLVDRAFETVRQQIFEGAGNEPVWSVAWLGRNHGYVTEVEFYGSKEKAMEAAKLHGDCYVVKGTQMWNEPLGQVEEHDREAWYRYIPGD